MKQIVRSNDLGLISALACVDFQIVSMVKEGNICYFVVEGEGLDVYVERYWLGGLQVDAQSYFQELKKIKSLIHRM